MSKKESIGISLLDVLTNSFAAAILLLVLVASTIGSGGNVQKEDPVEAGAQEIATTKLTYTKREKEDPPILFVEAKFPNGENLKLEFKGVQEVRDSISILNGLYDKNSWNIIRRGFTEKEWEIDIKKTNNNILTKQKDSIFLVITIGTAPIGVKIPNSDTALNNNPFLYFKEPVESHNEIYVFGNEIKSYIK